MNKKFICLLLAVCLCAGMLPMLVLATTLQTPQNPSSGTPYVEYPDAFNAGEQITLKFVSNSSNYVLHSWYVDEVNGSIFGLSVSNSSKIWDDIDGDSVSSGYYVPDTNSSTEWTFEANDDMDGKKVYCEYNLYGSTDKDLYVITLKKADATTGGNNGSIIIPGGPGIIGPSISARENGMGLAGPYIYDEDEDIMMTPAEAGHIHEYGDAAYYLLIDEVSVRKDDMAGMSGAPVGPMSDMDHVEKLKVKAKGWTNGGEIVEGVEVAKCKVNVDVPFVEENGLERAYDCAEVILGHGYESGYYYFLKIDLGEKESTSETDVIGVVEFNRKANSKKGIGKIDESTHDIDFSVFYEYGWLTKWPTITDDRVDFEWDTTYALKFDNDDEVELSFGTPNGGNNEGTFEVDTSGQGKVLLRYTTDADEAIAAANEGADIDFLIFNNVKFNRTGTFTYEMENGAYAYRIVDGKLVEMPDCYDEKEEAFVFNTHILGAYVFADRALVNPA